jgi:hypothetical protein
VVVAVLAALPARAGGVPGPSTPSYVKPAPTHLEARPAAWDRIGSVLHAAVVLEHPDAVVEDPVATQDGFVGGVRLSVQFHDRAGSGVVTVDVLPVGQAPPACSATGSLLGCSRTASPAGGWEQVATYDLGGHSPAPVRRAAVTVERVDGVVVTTSADVDRVGVGAGAVVPRGESVGMTTDALLVLARQSVALVPPLSGTDHAWTRLPGQNS